MKSPAAAAVASPPAPSQPPRAGHARRHLAVRYAGAAGAVCTAAASASTRATRSSEGRSPPRAAERIPSSSSLSSVISKRLLLSGQVSGQCPLAARGQTLDRFDADAQNLGDLG